MAALATETIALHLQQYFELYSEIPTIGTLFLLNFAVATVVGLGLLAPVERLAGRRGGATLALLTLAGIGQAATAFGFWPRAAPSARPSSCWERSWRPAS